jgi:hypothetical protein
MEPLLTALERGQCSDKALADAQALLAKGCVGATVGAPLSRPPPAPRSPDRLPAPYSAPLAAWSLARC